MSLCFDLGSVCLLGGSLRFSLQLSHLRIQLGKLVGMFLVESFEPLDLFGFPLVDLFADTSAMLGHEFWNFFGIAISVVMHQNPHHIGRSQFVLVGKLTVMSRRVDE